MYAMKTFFAIALTAGFTSSVFAQDRLNGLDPYSTQEGISLSLAPMSTSLGGMAIWTNGMVDIINTNRWYDVPNLQKTFNVNQKSLWRVYANVRYRFYPIKNGDYCSLRLRIVIDGTEMNLVGVVFDPLSSDGMQEINQHLNIETLAQLSPGNHIVKIQVLKWGAASSSHIDIFADYNGYSTLIWQKIGVFESPQ